MHPNEPLISLEILASVYPGEKPSFCYLPKIHKSMGEFMSFGVSNGSRLVRGSSEQIYSETFRVPFPMVSVLISAGSGLCTAKVVVGKQKKNIVTLAPGLEKGTWIRGLKVETV